MSGKTASTGERAESCLIVTADQNVGQQLCEGLRRRGCEVAWLHDAAESREKVVKMFDDAVARVGTPRLVVLSVVPTELQSCVDSDTISEEQWRQGLDAHARAFLYALQGAHGLMKTSGGGTIVCIGPAFGLVGAARLLALSTLLEAQRALVKSAARQWGSKGIRIHWVSLGETGSYSRLEAAPLPRTPELGPPPPALGRPPTAQDIAGLVHWLASDDAKVLTGATLIADGGEWMLP